MRDPIDELKRVAMRLEDQGHSADAIIDAAFRLAVNTSVRMHGREAVSNTLHDMAALVAAAMKPTTH